MNKYLLENSAETRQMIEHIKELLASSERVNLELAFQLLEAAGGIPKELYPFLTNTNEKILMCYRYRFFRVLE